MKIVHSLNYKRPKGEVNRLPSLTVPDMTLSLRQLLDNHTRGHELPVKFIPVYDEDNELPDPRTLDLVDVQNMRYDLEFRKSNLEKTVKDEKDAKKAALRDARKKTLDGSQGKEGETSPKIVETEVSQTNNNA